MHAFFPMENCSSPLNLKDKHYELFGTEQKFVQKIKLFLCANNSLEKYRNKCRVVQKLEEKQINNILREVPLQHILPEYTTYFCIFDTWTDGPGGASLYVCVLILEK